MPKTVYSAFPLTSAQAQDNIPGTKIAGSDAQAINGFINEGTTYPVPFVVGQAVILSKTGATATPEFPSVDAITSNGTTLSSLRVDYVIAYDQRVLEFVKSDAVALFSLASGAQVRLKAGTAFLAGETVYYNAQNQTFVNASVPNVTTRAVGVAMLGASASTPDNVQLVAVQLQAVPFA
jgi:hypothetical protein